MSNNEKKYVHELPEHLLMKRYMPTVLRLVDKYWEAYCKDIVDACIDKEDVKSFAIQGMLSAIKSYDKDKCRHGIGTIVMTQAATAIKVGVKKCTWGSSYGTAGVIRNVYYHAYD